MTPRELARERDRAARVLLGLPLLHAAPVAAVAAAAVVAAVVTPRAVTSADLGTVEGQQMLTRLEGNCSDESPIDLALHAAAVARVALHAKLRCRERGH